MRKESAVTIKACAGRVIARITVGGDAIEVHFADGSTLRLWDDGQDCCEERYMVCDDDPIPFAGSTLIGVSVKDAPDIAVPDGESHEVQFLEILTSAGAFTAVNHNEHNGFYGGFSVEARIETEAGQ